MASQEINVKSREKEIDVKRKNDNLVYSLECGCRSVNKYWNNGSYEQQGETRPIVEQSWEFIPCKNPEHQKFTSILDGIDAWKK